MFGSIGCRDSAAFIQAGCGIRLPIAIQPKELDRMKLNLLSVLLMTFLAICALAIGSVTDKYNATDNSSDDDTLYFQELLRKAEELNAKCALGDTDACEEGAGGFAQDMIGYLNLVLASSNDTFVSQVAPTLQRSWMTVLNITERLSSAAEPGERLLDSRLRTLTSIINETLYSLTQRTASFHAAHTSILKAARRSYLPGKRHFLSYVFMACSPILFKELRSCCGHC